MIITTFTRVDRAELFLRQIYRFFSFFNITSRFFFRDSKEAAIAKPENVSPRCGAPGARDTLPPLPVPPFHPFPLHSCSVILGRVARKTRRDATHLLPNYFAHGSVKNFPRCHYCSVARENLVICSFHCSSSRPVQKICCDVPLSFRGVAADNDRWNFDVVRRICARRNVIH